MPTPHTLRPLPFDEDDVELPAPHTLKTAAVLVWQTEPTAAEQVFFVKVASSVAFPSITVLLVMNVSQHWLLLLPPELLGKSSPVGSGPAAVIRVVRFDAFG